MPGLGMLRWFTQPTAPPAHQPRKGRGRRPQHVAAPPVVGTGVAAAAAVPVPQDDVSGDAPSSSSAAGGEVVTAQLPPLGPLLRLHAAVRAVAVPSLQLAGRLLARPWQPLQEQLEQQLAGMKGVQDACAALHVRELRELQDVLSALVLSECVYKVLDLDSWTAVQAINALKAHFPPQLVTLRRVQWAMPHAQHSFLMAEGSDALFVAFMGTKRPRDLVTNVDYFQDQILFDAAASVDADQPGGGGSDAPAAHRGFSARARSIPIEALYHQARSQGKRLVLCGHSLGGAVAQLCAIRLLQQLPESAHSTVSVVGFATPPVANQALAAVSKLNGWDRRMRNYLLPEDPIPGLLSARQPPRANGTDGAAGAIDAAQPAAAAAAQPGASAALASVSVQGGGVLVQAGGSGSGAQLKLPGLPGRAFWGQQGAFPLLARSLGAPPAAAAEARGSGVDAAEDEPVSGTGPAAGEGPAAEQGSSMSTPGRGRLVNNIAAAPSIGLSRLGRLARHMTPRHVAAGAQQQAGGSAAVAGADMSLAPAGEAVEEAGTDIGSPSAATAAAANLHSSPLPSASTDSVGAADEEAAGQPRRGRRWMVPRPPLEAMAQSAQAAARLIATPLTVAATMPTKLAPQYVGLGQTLYVEPGRVSTSRPQTRSGKEEGGSLPRSRSTGVLAVGPSAAAAASPGAERPAAAAAPAAAVGARVGLPRSLPRLGRAASAPALGSLEAGTGSVDAGDGGAKAESAATAGAGALAAAAAAEESALAPTKLPPRTIFPMHRMLSHRIRILGILNDNLRGRVWLPALPHLPNVPHPDDVSLSMLIAPGMFPLKAEASVHSGGLAGTGAPAPVAVPPPPRSRRRAGRQPGTAAKSNAAALASGPAPAAQEAAAPTTAAGVDAASPARPQRQRWSLLRLLRRPGAQHEEGPVEVEVKVQGKGLHTVTRAWVEGVPAAAKEREGEAAGVVAAQIVWQPSPPAPAAVHRRPLQAITPVASFFSWLAVAWGWVALLRQLQPAGQHDYLVARVQLPAAVVRAAQLAAENPLQAAVNDAHLPGVRVGPKLTVHLQSDFSCTSLPLDIRVAMDVDAQMGWRRRLPRWRWQG